MGMSASQARYLSLVGRKNNIEYQGQQINQERTILSQQCTALYNSLLDMTVPTPPSTSDYTKVVYTGLDGASSFTIGSIVPHNGTYSVDFLYTKTGHYVDEAGTAAATGAPERLKLTVEQNPITNGTSYYDVSNIQPGIAAQPQAYDRVLQFIGTVDSQTTGVHYVLEGNKLKKVDFAQQGNIEKYSGKNLYDETDGSQYVYDPQDPNKSKHFLIGHDAQNQPINASQGYGYSKVELSNSYYVIINGSFRSIHDDDFGTVVGDTGSLFVLQSDGTYLFNPLNSEQLSLRSSAELVPEGSQEGYANLEKGDLIGMVADKPCYTLTMADSQHRNMITDDSMESYIEAIRNAFPEYADPEQYSDADIKELFGVYFTKDASTGRNVPHFVKTTEVLSSIGDVNDDHYIPTYDYIANGRYTATENKKNCLLTFDAQGRITEVKIPVSVAADGSVATYRTVKLSAERKTDDEAYQKAYNDYEYAQYLYDKKQQEINAKTEIIQQEDKNLELKLTRLDNERKALDTELDAVKKVIEDNIDKSYKTFSG